MGGWQENRWVDGESRERRGVSNLRGEERRGEVHFKEVGRGEQRGYSLAGQCQLGKLFRKFGFFMADMRRCRHLST